MANEEAADMAKPENKKKALFTLIVILILIPVVILARGAINRARGTTYIEETAITRTIKTYYSFSGIIEAINRQTVLSLQLMQVKKIHVRQGDRVSEGDVLLTPSMGEAVKAGITGEVASVYVEEGAQLTGGTKLFELVEYDNLKVTIKVDEYDLKAIAVGMPVEIIINALDTQVDGEVASISREAVNVNGVSYFTSVIHLEKDVSLRVGMSTEVRLENKTVADALSLGMDAVQFNSEDEPYVLIRDDNGDITAVSVETGLNDGASVEIKAGLEAGQVVLIPIEATSQSYAAKMRTSVTGGR